MPKNVWVFYKCTCFIIPYRYVFLQRKVFYYKRIRVSFMVGDGHAHLLKIHHSEVELIFSGAVITSITVA